jgi:hypothetical protein
LALVDRVKTVAAGRLRAILMYWVFVVVTLGAVAYGIYILVQHAQEARLVNIQIQHNRTEKISLEEAVQDCENERDAAKARAAGLEKEVGEVQTSVDELQAAIRARKRESERRGKFRV